MKKTTPSSPSRPTAKPTTKPTTKPLAKPLAKPTTTTTKSPAAPSSAPVVVPAAPVVAPAAPAAPRPYPLWSVFEVRRFAEDHGQPLSRLAGRAQDLELDGRALFLLAQQGLSMGSVEAAVGGYALEKELTREEREELVGMVRSLPLFKVEEIIARGFFKEFPGRVNVLSKLPEEVELAVGADKWPVLVDPTGRAATFYAYNAVVISAKAVIMARFQGKSPAEVKKDLATKVFFGLRQSPISRSILCLDIGNSAPDIESWFDPACFPRQLFQGQLAMRDEDIVLSNFDKANFKDEDWNAFLPARDFLFVVTVQAENADHLQDVIKANPRMQLIKILPDSI